MEFIDDQMIDENGIHRKRST